VGCNTAPSTGQFWDGGRLDHLGADGPRVLRTLADLQSDLKREERVAALCLEAYADTHVFSPPTATLDEWQDIFLGEGYLEEAFFIAVRDGRYHSNGLAVGRCIAR
jgi:hypothetical protein